MPDTDTDTALTGVQLEALQALADGLDARGYAMRAGISVFAVDGRITRAIEALGCDNPAGAVAEGFRRGLVR